MFHKLLSKFLQLFLTLLYLSCQVPYQFDLFTNIYQLLQYHQRRMKHAQHKYFTQGREKEREGVQ